MKIPSAIAAAISAFWITACTTVPSRFTPDKLDPDSTGYVVGPQTADGFGLEVFYVTYRFLPLPDSAVEEARVSFIRIANDIAKERGLKIVPLHTTDIQASPTRNTISGQYAVYVTGFVKTQQ